MRGTWFLGIFATICFNFLVVNSEKKVINLGQQDDMWEGDIKVDPKKRNGIFKAKRWTNGIIPYTLNMTAGGKFDQSHVDMIEEAMRTIERSTCVRFVKRTTEVDNLVIFNGNACYSTIVGMQGGTQYVSLKDAVGTTCFTHAIIMHELLHVIGLYHEQCRYDRDQYVTIRWDRLKKNDSQSEYQLRLVPNSESSDYGIPYNYASVMHYDAWAMGNGTAGAFVMEPKDPAMVTIMGYAKYANETDFEKVRRIYDCKERYTHAPTTPIPCEDIDNDCSYEAHNCGKIEYLVTRCRKTCGYCEWGKTAPSRTPSPFCEDRRNDCDHYAPKCGIESWLDKSCAFTCGTCDKLKTRVPTTLFTTQPTKPPTTTNPFCEDVIDYCPSVEHKCGQKDQEWMEEACRFTCGFCDRSKTRIPQKCEDIYADCQVYLRNCGSPDPWIKSNCRKTCKFC